MPFTRDIFGTSERLTMFEEPVEVYCSRNDSDGVTRQGTVRATVVVGSGLSNGAGAPIHSETADRFTARIRRTEWGRNFDFSPRFGMRLKTEKYGEIIVKAVQASGYVFVMRCSQDMRAED